MNPVLRVLVRSSVLGLLIVGYDAGYDLVVPATPDADIGKGLLLFLLLAVVAGVWGFVDGLRHLLWSTAGTWVATAALVALGWQAVLAYAEQDETMSFTELMLQPSSLVFSFWLVAVPSVLAVGIGVQARRQGNPAPSAPTPRS